MTKRLIAALAAATLVAAASSQLLATAADVGGGENYIYRNMLLDTLENYEISDISVNSNVTYVYGSINGIYCVCIWNGATSYRTIYDTTHTIPQNNFYKSNDYRCKFNSYYIGAPYIASFFYDEGNRYELKTVYTNDVGNYNAVQQPEKAHYLQTDETGDTIGAQIRYIIDTFLPVEEPTEPTETTAPSFALPDNWVNTVEKTEPSYEMFTETIPTMTVPTLPEDIVSKTMLIPKILFDISRHTWFFPIFMFCIIVTLLTYFIWLR